MRAFCGPSFHRVSSLSRRSWVRRGGRAAHRAAAAGTATAAPAAATAPAAIPGGSPAWHPWFIGLSGPLGMAICSLALDSAMRRWDCPDEDEHPAGRR